MRRIRRSTVVLFAAFLCAAPASAGVRIVGTGHPATKHEKFGFDFGPRIAFSIPTGESDVFDHGIDAGFTFTSMQTRYAGIGLEVGYRHWPSPKTGAALDEFYSRISGTSIRGTQVSVDAVGVFTHVRVASLPDRGITPWAEGSVGFVRSVGTVRNPVETLLGPGWYMNLPSSHDVTWGPDFCVRAGFDVSSQRAVRVGPDVSYRWVFIDGNRNDQFTAFGAGLHVRFGMP